MKKTIGSIVGLGSLLIASQAFAANWVAREAINADVSATALKELASCKLSATTYIVAGGLDPVSDVQDDSYIYDSTANDWGTAIAMPIPVAQGRMVAYTEAPIGGGAPVTKCAYIGGVTLDNSVPPQVVPSDEILIFNDAGTGVWSNPGSFELQQARFDAELVKISNTLILAIAGDDGAVLDTVERIDLASGSRGTSLLEDLNPSPNFLQGRTDFQAVTLPNGSDFDVFIIGGNDGSSILAAANNVDVLTVDSNADFLNIATESLPNGTQRDKFVAFAEPFVESATNYGILAAGGSNGSDLASALGRQSNGTWDLLSLTLDAASSDLKVCTAGSNFIVATGTGQFSQVWDAAQDRFEDAAGTANASDAMLTTRIDGSALECLGSQAFAAGGFDGVNVLSSHERSP